MYNQAGIYCRYQHYHNQDNIQDTFCIDHFKHNNLSHILHNNLSNDNACNLLDCIECILCFLKSAHHSNSGNTQVNELNMFYMLENKPCSHPFTNKILLNNECMSQVLNTHGILHGNGHIFMLNLLYKQLFHHQAQKGLIGISLQSKQSH